MGGLFSKEKSRESDFQRLVIEAFSCLESDDLSTAKSKYSQAHSILSSMPNTRRQLFTTQLKSLYDQLHLCHRKNLLNDSVAKSEEALARLGTEVLRVEESTSRVYLDFLLKEKEYSQLVSELHKEKALLEEARAELASELNLIRSGRIQDSVTPIQKFHASLAILDNHLKNKDINSALGHYPEIRLIYGKLSPEEKNTAFELLLPRIRNLSPALALGPRP